MIEQLRVALWVRGLDALTVLLALLAAVIALSGGFRVHVGGMRVGVTTPLPLLFWSLAIGVVRHLAVPHEPLYREFPRRLRSWASLPGVRVATAAIVSTRPAILFIGYAAVFMFGYAEGHAPLRHFNNELLNLPVRWDAGWYLQIVTDGYHYSPEDAASQQNIVFFPAYPMLIRVVGRVLGGNMIGYVWGGMVLSLAAFFGALVYMHAVARDALGEDAARYSLWLLAAYPFALFFGAVYTESLFLLGTLGAFYHFSKQQFGRAALWGVLVGLTRLNGSMLSLPLALLAIQSARPHQSNVKAFAAAAAPIAGLAIYAAFIWRTTGDPLAFLTGQLAWGRTYQGLGALVSTQYSIIAKTGLSGYVGTPGYDVLNAIGALFAIATIYPVARRVGFAYALFMAINILPAMANGGLLSAGRFSSVLFPAFIWLAAVIPLNHRAGWIASFAALQAYNAALFYTWRPLF
jgi:mannosyltransferase PIG-V